MCCHCFSSVFFLVSESLRVCVCAWPLSLTKDLLLPIPIRLRCLVLAIPPARLCANHTRVLACVCPYIHVYSYVMKVVNINNYQQTRDDATCNIKVETEKDILSDVTQAVK